MTIKYKVIRNSRMSAYASGRYERVYNIGDVVIAEPGSFGIMCFNSERAAIEFMRSHGFTHFKMILVIAKGKGRRPKYISCRQSQSGIESFYYDEPEWHGKQKSPRGTICYDKVEVLT